MTLPNGKVHPVAELFPMLAADELKELADDIATNGQQHPIVLMPDGTLLDGRNRLAACDIAAVDPSFTTYHGDDPVGHVVSLNVRRRHLSVGQRAALAHELLPHYEAQANARRAATQFGVDETVRADLHTPARAAEEAGKAVGVSGRAVAQFKRVAEKAPELAAKVRSGDMALDAADRSIKQKAERERHEAEAERWRQDLLSQQELLNNHEPDPEDDWRRREKTELAIIGLVRELQRFTESVTPDDLAHALATGFEHVARNNRTRLRALLPLLNDYLEVIDQ